MNIEKARCTAMISAGIADATSKEGIDFCTESCPYECGCILFEPGAAFRVKLRARRAFETDLWKHGVSIADIAAIVGVTYRTVKRDLKK